jgi:hypothetical protein
MVRMRHCSDLRSLHIAKVATREAAESTLLINVVATVATFYKVEELLGK